MTEEQAAQLQALVDREAIRDVIMRYCFACDRCDAAVLYSVYWPEATEDHGVFKGPVEEWVPFAMNVAKGKTDQMQHLVGNILIRLNGNAARCESYFHHYQRNRTETGPQDFFLAGRYLDQMEKRNREWRILRRKVMFDWSRTLKDSADWSQGIAGHLVPMGGRMPDDEVYKLFQQDSISKPSNS